MKSSIRATNMGRGVAWLDGGLCRLLVDGVPRAPERASVESLAPRSAEEGEFDFDIPKATEALVLTVGRGENPTAIPIVLAKSG